MSFDELLIMIVEIFRDIWPFLAMILLIIGNRTNNKKINSIVESINSIIMSDKEVDNKMVTLTKNKNQIKTNIESEDTTVKQVDSKTEFVESYITLFVLDDRVIDIDMKGYVHIKVHDVLNKTLDDAKKYINDNCHNCTVTVAHLSKD